MCLLHFFSYPLLRLNRNVQIRPDYCLKHSTDYSTDYHENCFKQFHLVDIFEGTQNAFMLAHKND